MNEKIPSFIMHIQINTVTNIQNFRQIPEYDIYNDFETAPCLLYKE